MPPLSLITAACFIVYSGTDIIAAALAESAIPANSSCKLSVIGTLGEPDSVQHASLHCTGMYNLKLVVDPIIAPFIDGFTGVSVSKADSTTQATSALFWFCGDLVNLVDSSVQDVITTRDSIIFLDTNNVSVANSTFSLNTALLTAGIAASGTAHLSLQHCSFISNSAGSHGAIYFNSSSSNCSLTQDCTIFISRTLFANNSAPAGIAGGVYLASDGYQIWVSHSVYMYNSAGSGTYNPLAANEVGGMTVVSSGSAKLGQTSGNNVFIHNTSFDSNSGGAIGALNLEKLQCISFSNNTFLNNTGALGAVYVLQVSGDPSFCTQQTHDTPFAAQLAPNTTNMFADTYNLDIRNTKFISNFRALYLDTLQQPVSVVDCVFEHNEAVVEPGTGGAGGGLYMVGSFFACVTIVNCHFNHNMSPFLGGALFVLSFSIQHIIDSCVFEGNQAAVSGGAVAMVDGSLTVNSSKVINNIAGSEGGGGLTCRDCVRLSLVNTSLENNTCQDVGGAIKVSGLPASDVVLDQVSATGNTAVSGGALSVDSIGNFGNTYVLINNSTFINNSAIGLSVGSDFSTLGGLGGALRIFTAVLWVTSTAFEQNNANTVGGAIFFDQSCALAPLVYYAAQHQLDLGAYLADQTCTLFMVSVSQLANNAAQGAGGAIYTTSSTGFYTACAKPSTASAGMEDLATVFAFFKQAQNTTDAIATLPIVCPEWQSAGNTAVSYGDVVAYPAARLSLHCNPHGPNGYTCPQADAGSPLGDLTVEQFWSTNAVDASIDESVARLVLDVTLLDMANQTMLMDFPRTRPPLVHVASPIDNPSMLSGQLTATVNPTTQSASFTTLLVKAKPGVYTITFTATDHLDLPTSLAVVHVRSCLLGEISGEAGNVCDQCPSSQYSLDQADVACSPCPANAVCPGGTAAVMPVEGYWHSAVKSTLMHSCPNQHACRGDRVALESWQRAWNADGSNRQAQANSTCQTGDCAVTSQTLYLDQQCSSGYEGPLCTVCSPNHGLSGHFACHVCPRHALAAFKYLLVLIGTVAVNAFLIWRSLNDHSTGGHQAESSDYVEALLTYVQLASVLTLLDIKWPSLLGGLFKAFAWITHLNPQSAALDCILPRNNTGLPLSVTRTLVQLAIPLIILTAFCVAWVAAYAYLQNKQPSHDRDRRWLRKRLMLSCYSVLGYFYPSLTQAALGVFACYPIDHPVPTGTLYQSFLEATWPAGYWEADMRHACFAGWHLVVTLALGLPSVLLLSVGVPLVFWLMLFQKRQHLGTSDCKHQLGYLYKSYRPNCWWEGPMSQLKLLALLLVIVNGRPLGTYIPSLMVLGLLCFEHVYQQLLQPLRTSKLQHIQTATLVLLTYTVIAGLMLQDYEAEASQAGLTAAAVLVGIANCLLVAYLLYIITSRYLGSVKRVASRINTSFVALQPNSGSVLAVRQSSGVLPSV